MKNRATFCSLPHQIVREKNCIAWTTGGAMIAKCCNPECEVPFDYREGRLIRFSRPMNGEISENERLIQHFWLCGKCAGLYVFEYESGVDVKIKPRRRELSEKSSAHFVSAA
jgi:hypothetical protein